MMADRLIPLARGNNDCEIRRLYGDRDLTRQKELSLSVNQAEGTVEEGGPSAPIWIGACRLASGW